ncbi:MAG TPA: DUF3108 domain-containing protein [Pyrinomonadaceae bacterium]
MKRYLKFLAVSLAAFAFYGVSHAQPSAPFDQGEVITYEGKVSKIIPGITVADLTFTVDRIEGEDFLIKAEARSKGTLLKLFRFSFLQRFESTIDDRDFRVVKTVKHDVQKDRVRDSEALFDYGEKRVTWTETDPKEPMKPPRRIASEIDGATHDLISGVYTLRMLPLAVGKTFHLKISDSGLVYDVPVKVIARERQKTEIGKVMCFRVEPLVFGPGRLIEGDGKMIIWITDDARRLPVRSQVHASFGKVEIKIQSISTKNDTLQASKKN